MRVWWQVDVSAIQGQMAKHVPHMQSYRVEAKAMSVKRYDFNGDATEFDDGKFVLHSDYAALEAERDWLIDVITKAGLQELIRFERAAAIRAFDILADALNWKSGGLESAAQEIVNERDRLKKAYGSLREDIMKAPIMPRNVWDYTRDALARAEAVRKGDKS